jgi:hypothetical protein
MAELKELLLAAAMVDDGRHIAYRHITVGEHPAVRSCVGVGAGTRAGSAGPRGRVIRSLVDGGKVDSCQHEAPAQPILRPAQITDRGP